MAKQNHIYGLMAGITIGFAFWGSSNVGAPQAREAVISAEQPVRVLEPLDDAQEDSLSLHALSAVLMDGDSGRILYEKQGDVFRPMASTTKIMTCILALEEGNLSDICTVSDVAASQPKVHLGASRGTQFYLKDLLYSLMLESHNDSAVIIAEHLGGSVEGFARMMNEKAKEIGCENTCFVTPNGLDAMYTTPDGKQLTHGTTAADLAKIMCYCARKSPKRNEFLAITQTAGYTFSDTEGKGDYSCVNHNAFLTMMDGVLCGKTGFTNGAGYSYVAALEDDGRTFVLALLGSGWPPHKTYKWADARTLFDYGKNRYHFRDVYEEPQFRPVPVLNGIPPLKPGDTNRQLIGSPATITLTTGLPDSQKHLEILLAESEQVQQKTEIPAAVEAPVHKGEVIGRITYLLNGEAIETYPLYAGQSVSRIDLLYCIEQIWLRFCFCDG